MRHIVKDVLNLSNWLKIYNNPSKFIRVFNDRINYYPGLQFGYTKSKIIKKLYMSFNIFFAKKNKNFKEFFFDTGNDEKKVAANFSLNKDYHINEIQFQYLKQNGILVLENALPEHEQNKIAEEFDKFKSNINNDDLNEYRDKNLSVFKNENIDKYMYTVNSVLNSESKLKKINDQITKKIYGITVNPSLSYGFHKLIDLPESVINGDNNWHADRYLPNLKILYFPYGVEEGGAPFRYSLGSHKINKESLNFFLNKKIGSGTIEGNEEKAKFLKNTHEFIVPPNTLVATLPNGFHGRTPFKKKSERCALYLMYKEFRLWSLISYWNCNDN